MSTRRLARKKHELGHPLQDVVEALCHNLGDNLVALVLFGSRARGDAQPESDWDLLLIASDLPSDTLGRHFYLKQQLPAELAGQISLVGQTPAELESYLTSLLLDIAFDGIVLHDTNHYITNRLQQIQQLARQKGLQRHQLGQEFQWQWGTPAPLAWVIEWEKEHAQ